jgi:lipopolysaccharide export system protein LptA
MKSLSIAILGLLAASVLDAQGSRLIEVKSADVLHVRFIDGQEVRELIGNVHVIQSSPGELMKIWCDTALRYMETNKIELFGHVKLVRDSVTLTSHQGVYYGNDRRAEMSKGVRLTRGGSVLTSKFGEYFAEAKRAHFTGRVHVVDSTSSTWSDALTYFESEEKSIAVGNVRVYNSENNLTVFGDSLIYFEKVKYTLLPRNPRMVQVDTSSSGALDTMLVTSDVMETYQDSLPRFIARGGVAMVRTDLAAVCKEATYFLKRDRIVLRGDPVVWHTENQLSGDSVVITTADRKLQSVYVSGRAVAVSRADSLLRQRYDQLTAREITMYFAAGKIAHIDAERNATSLYYLFDEGEPNGANRSSGDRIVMEFQDGKIDQIRIVGGVEGKYFPESMIAGKEPRLNLDGFRWITSRPKRQHLQIVNARYK